MDAQTGVYTKDYIDSYIEKLFAEGKVTDYTAAIFDVHGLSTIINQLGDEEGTHLMAGFVQGLQDVIGTKGVVARVDGSSFEAIFPDNMTDPVAEYLKGVELELSTGNGERFISARAGFYSVTDNCHSYVDYKTIMKEALRTARNNPNNAQSIVIDDKILKQISESKQIESMFRDAILNEEFLVYYQPKVELKEYKLKGAEALCRWMHDGQMIMPFKFIPVFEHSGDICELDFYMLEHVCRDLRKWLDEGKEIVRVSVNLSRGNMGDRHLLEKLIGVVDKYDVPHQYIEIELTETSSDVDYMELREIVEGLSAVGIRTSVDDFGVGYSSMNLIRELPWNMIKIDKSFVPEGDGSEEDGKKLILLSTLIQMTQALGMQCLAEGVETVEQVILLKQNGCFLAQGYFFDKPLPKEEFEKRIDALTEIVRLSER